MSKENNIDRLFREGLSDFSATPPTHVWDAINAEIKSNRKQKMVLLLWKGSAAAAFIGVIILAGILLHTSNTESPKYLTNLQPDSGLIISENENKQTNETGATSISNTISTNKDVEQKESLYVHELQNQKENSNINKEIKTVAFKNSEEYTNSNLLSAQNNTQIKKEVLLKAISNKDVITHTETIDPSTVFFLQNSDMDNKRMADMIFGDSEDEEEIKKELFAAISVGGQIAPSYSYRDGNNNSAKNESGITKLTGGVNVNFKTSKRFRIETGLLYAQVGQKFSNSSYTPSNSVAFGLLEDNIQPAPSANSYQNSMGNIVPKSSSSGKMFDAAPSTDFEASRTISNMAFFRNSEVEIQQELEYIEIPFILKYDIINKGIALSVNGGVSTNVLVGNNAYNISNNTRNKIGMIEGINAVSYSASFGLGLRTPINSSFDFNVEPRFKYFINSITSSSEYEYKPYSLGLLIGVNYKF
ncbi:outer membrane beta-barrel protein [Plebeiibacterium sediminum]|uniref:Outer membrane protein beta-barrel domain-containing protein n=1 Tax=Plebeiibacterium sediminum TaxID=2992112 RepID=A0AAE3M9G5_9BACT|nr:hypothetical protein [Plebeiobacterium sediminum]MCW3789055.1 hypothetical protein [Plebeiobacterium sediminum]